MTEFVVRHYEEVSLDTLGNIMFGNCPGEEGARFEFKLRLIISDGVKIHLEDIEIEKVDVTRWDVKGGNLKTRIPEDFVPKIVMDRMKLNVKQDFAMNAIDLDGIMYERQTDDI